MESTSSWFDEGVKAFKGADFEKAVAAFDKALALDAGHFASLKQRAFALAALGQHEAALDSFVAAAARDLGDAEVVLGAAQSLLKLRRVDEALQSFERALSLRPFDLKAQCGRAEALMAAGEFERGLSALDAMLAVPDKDKALRAHALRARLLALGRLGRPEAFAAFCECLKSELVHFAQGDRRDALGRAIEKPELARAAFLSWVDAHAREPSTWSRVEELWSARAWSVLTAFANAWFQQGEADLQAGKLTHAIWHYERALELWPELSAAASQLSVATRQRDGGRWMVMRHNSYAREDYFVAEFATKAEAESRVRELNAAGEDHHWAVPIT